MNGRLVLSIYHKSEYSVWTSSILVMSLGSSGPKLVLASREALCVHVCVCVCMEGERQAIRGRVSMKVGAEWEDVFE